MDDMSKLHMNWDKRKPISTKISIEIENIERS